MARREIRRIVIEFGEMPIVRAYGKTILTSTEGEEFDKPGGEVEPVTSDATQLVAATAFAQSLVAHLTQRDSYEHALAGVAKVQTP